MALAALCYAELAAMIPQAGSAYAYSYATLGELVAWIIGWDLILEYAVGNIAVAISWGDYFSTLLRGIGDRAAAVLLTTAIARRFSARSRRCTGCSNGAARSPGCRCSINVPAFVIVHVGHVAAAARRARERARQQRHGRHQAPGARSLHRRRR